MPRPRPHLPPHLAEQLAITLGDVRAAGLTRAQLPGLGLDSVHRGVYVRAGTAERLDVRCAAALAALPKGSVISHATAAELRDLPVRPSAVVHVSVPVSKVMPEIAGVRVHAVTGPPAADEIRGIPVTTAARTWVDLAGRSGRDEVVMVGDQILHRCLATKADLECGIDDRRTRRGSARARLWLPLLEPRTESPSETRLRLIVHDARLPRPEANVDINDDDHGWIGRPDFSYRHWRVGLQMEGDRHRTDRDRFRKDIRRDEVMVAHGWLILRFVEYDLHPRRHSLTAGRVRDALVARGAAL